MKRVEADITNRLSLDDSDSSRSRLSIAVLWYFEKFPKDLFPPEISQSKKLSVAYYFSDLFQRLNLHIGCRVETRLKKSPQQGRVRG